MVTLNYLCIDCDSNPCTCGPLSDQRLQEIDWHMSTKLVHPEPYLSQVLELRKEVTRLRNAHQDRVAMLAFVQGELNKRNTECVELRERCQRLEGAIRWALGEEGAFPEEPPPLAGKYRQRYHWRTGLRERAGLAAADWNAVDESKCLAIHAVTGRQEHERCDQYPHCPCGGPQESATGDVVADGQPDLLTVDEVLSALTPEQRAATEARRQQMFGDFPTGDGVEGE